MKQPPGVPRCDKAYQSFLLAKRVQQHSMRGPPASDEQSPYIMKRQASDFQRARTQALVYGGCKRNWGKQSNPCFPYPDGDEGPGSSALLAPEHTRDGARGGREGSRAQFRSTFESSALGRPSTVPGSMQSRETVPGSRESSRIQAWS